MRCSPQISRYPESFSNVNLDSPGTESFESSEVHYCLVYDTCFLLKHKRMHLCLRFRETHTNDRFSVRPTLRRRLCTIDVVADILVIERIFLLCDKT
ncbi:hypothetical protein TNCV_3589471 [Trichonephila clavipes]|nr:hypothetical protein TNCV_3589471 [Trichonephila clavipes]